MPNIETSPDYKKSDFTRFLQSERTKVNKNIHESFLDIIEAEPESYLRKFYHFVQEFLLQGGRRLHPIAMVQAYRGLASDRDIIEYGDEIYKVSVAAELMHVASLILDDLIDQESLRLGKSTFHLRLAEFGQENLKAGSEDKFISATTIYGSNLISLLGTNIIQRSPFPLQRRNKGVNLLLKGLQGVLRGRLMNEYYRMIPLDRVGLEDYLILAGLKRGTQMETAVGLGALFGNGRSSQIEPLQQVMQKIGIIEQLFNDLNGSFGNPEKKSIDSDIKTGQLTALTVIAYQSADEQQKNVLNKTLGNPNATTEEIESVRDIFKSTGAVDFIHYYSNSLRNDLYYILKEQVYPGLRQESFKFFTQDLIEHIILYDDT